MMVLRFLVLCLTGGGAYFLLKGMPQVIPVMVRGCLAVLLLVGGLGWWATSRQSRGIEMVYGRRKLRWVDLLSIGMAVLAMECGFLWLLSAAPRPLERVAQEMEVYFFPEKAGAGKDQVDDLQVSGNWLWDDRQQRVLPKQTNLKPGVKPEVFIRLPRSDDAGRLLHRQVYVRAFVLDEFRNGAWSVGTTDEEELEAGRDGWIRFHEAASEGILHEVFHGNTHGDKGVLIGLQGVEAVRVPGLHQMKDGVWFLPEEVKGSTGYEYFASSRPLVLEDLKGKTIEAGPEVRRAGGGYGRFSHLAKEAAGEGGILEKLLNIQEFMRENYSYSLVTSNPKNLNALENFIFEEKRGHCEFFATGAALMVREMGLESRVAYGWAGGQYFRDSQMFVFRAREAHSWVEVKLPGYGWVAMEPTPLVEVGGGGAVPRVAGAGEEMPKPEEVTADNRLSKDEKADLRMRQLALILAAGFALCALAFFMWRGRGRHAVGSAGTGQIVKRSGYHRAWLRVVERELGIQANAMTLGQQLAALAERPEFGDELHGYHYGVRYGQKPVDDKREAKLERAIRKWGRERL